MPVAEYIMFNNGGDIDRAPKLDKLLAFLFPGKYIMDIIDLWQINPIRQQSNAPEDTEKVQARFIQ